MEKMEKEFMKNISGGVSEAANGTFWLTDEESSYLKEKGFVLSDWKDLPGWEGIEFGTLFNGKVTYQVNTSDGRRATLKELEDVLYPKNE